MPRYRHDLPQLSEKVFMTDGGLETTLIFHHGLELPEFASCDLLPHEEGRSTLTSYYEDYATIARDHGLGFILESVSWRASPDWISAIGYPDDAVEVLTRQSIELLEPIRDRFNSNSTPMVISGCIGPRGDGYTPGTEMSIEEARAYHARQVNTLADTEADMISAMTLNYVAEGAGIALAARDAGMQAVLSFTTETDGRLPTGESLAEVIDRVDDIAGDAVAYYMINCAHTSHFADVLEDAPWVHRIRGTRANASRKSHAELDEATELDDGNPEEFGHEHGELHERFPHFNIFGGCCGTDTRHVAAVAKGRVRMAA